VPRVCRHSIDVRRIGAFVFLARANMRTIHEAAVLALKDIGAPAHVTDILAQIQAKGYYSFRAQDPKTVLAMELARHCVGAKLRNSGRPTFARVGPGTYALLEVDWHPSIASGGR
jgi:hypothetical protein